MPRLVTTVDGRSVEYELSGVVTIGRSSQCTIRISGGKVSRSHAKMFERGGAWVVEDQGSSNGTLVNGRKTPSATLSSGDTVRVGSTDFTFIEVIDDPLLGKVLGNFQILERLGRGGMGTVYKAKQITMDREVALKVMRPDLAAQPGFVKDFQNEARLAGRLNHRNLIAIHDVMEVNGHHFFSMELVKGDNLMDRIAAFGSLPPEETLRIARQIAEALEHAHSRNILHQDIKPRNVLLTADGTVKLADLGLAKVMKYGYANTGGEYVMATPLYAAPEIIRRQPADVRSDVYSLAASMFHMATGLPPYQGSDAESIVRQHLNAPVPDPRALQGDAPDALAALIMKGLAKGPAARQQSCAELLKEIDAAVAEIAKKRNRESQGQKAVSVPAAAKSAFNEAMNDHTDRLPRSNPWKPVAVAIFSLGTVALAAVLALGIHYVFFRQAKSPAAKRLEHALQLLQAGKTQEAKLELADVRDLYEGSSEAARAAEQLARLAPKDNGLAPAEQLREPVAVPAETATAPGSEAGGEEDSAAARTAKAWAMVLPVVDGHLAKREYAEAAKMVADFIESHQGEESSPAALAKQTEVRDLINREGRGALDAALALKRGGKTGEAYAAFAAAAAAFAGTSFSIDAEKEMSGIDADAVREILALWDSLSSGLRNVDCGNLKADADALAGRLAGLPQATAARELGLLAGGLNAFGEKLRATVAAAGAGGSPAGVEGMGLANLIVDHGILIAIISGSRSPTGWDKVSLEDVWKFAPAGSLDKDGCAGAALFCAARGHAGFVKSYLKNAGESGGLAAQVAALGDNRVVTERMDFGDIACQRRWENLEGEWLFLGGAFRATGGEISTAELKGRLFQLRDLAINWKTTCDKADGQASLELERSETESISVRRAGDNVTLEFVGGGAPARASGVLAAGAGELRLTLRGEKAVLTAGGSKAAELAVPGSAGWTARLRVRFAGSAGSLGSLSVEEGR